MTDEKKLWKFVCKKNKQTFPSGFSISIVSSFRNIGNKHGEYRGKDCMKKFWEFLRERVMKIISFKKKRKKITDKKAAGFI